ncbi:hypothetical protein Tco_0989133 [Tanacetum coccineum]|uniref:Uncharacterized protein n=1 Tax=Tanacetum coccineum TaxID=301880 RepID=A0ABQ5ESZ9_9ASTR
MLDLRKGSKARRLKSLKRRKQAVVREGSSAAHNKYYDSFDTDSDATLYSLSSEKPEESANETDDANESDMDLSDDNLDEDNDVVRYGVFMHNKSTTTPNSTYLSLTVTSSSLDFIQTLLDETPANELIDFMSHPVYTDAQTTLLVHNPKGNPELTSYISGASKVPLGIHVDVLATKTLVQEMFPDENAHHLSSPPATKTSYLTTHLQPSSLQAKAKKMMQKAKKNMRKINFKKAVAQKFREYDQMEALTNFNVSEAFKKVVQAKVLIEIKKLLPTHIPKVVANYVRPRLNTFVLELKLLNRIYSNKSNETHTTHQQLYDTLYESITLDQQAFDAQDAKPSFHKRSHDNQDSPNNREGENKKKRQKDVSEPPSRSSRRNKSPMIHAQVDTPAIQPLDPEDEYIQTRRNPEWYSKSGSASATKRKTTWFDLLLKLDIDQNENHILGPSTVAIVKKLKAIIQKDELTIADLEGARLERLKQQYQNDVELEYHVSQLKAAVLTEAK